MRINIVAPEARCILGEGEILTENKKGANSQKHRDVDFMSEQKNRIALYDMACSLCEATYNESGVRRYYLNINREALSKLKKIDDITFRVRAVTSVIGNTVSELKVEAENKSSYLLSLLGRNEVVHENFV